MTTASNTELKTNWGHVGWLLVRRAGGTRIEIEIDGKLVARGYLTTGGEVMCDDETGWIAPELDGPVDTLSAEGVRVFAAAERLIAAGRSNYVYSDS